MSTPGPFGAIPAVLSCALLLTWPAVWNGYPLVFSDTGTYIDQAILRYGGWDRPVFYSWFLFALHWQSTLWLAVAGQALIVSGVLWLAVRAVLGRRPMALAGIGALLALTTSLPWFTSQLMPDVFTFVMVLCVFLLVAAPHTLSALERAAVALLLVGSILVHQSHLVLAAGLSVLLVLLRLAKQKRFGWRGAALALAPPALAALLLSAVNLYGHGRFAPSPYGNVFVLARVLADGPGRAHLDAACPQAGYRLCPFRQLITDDSDEFLWNMQGPLWQAGGPKEIAKEATAIITAAIAAQPMEQLSASARNFQDQLFRFETGDGMIPWVGRPEGPQARIARFFPHEYQAYLAARQQTGQLAPMLAMLQPLHVAVGWAALLGVLAGLAWALLAPWSSALALVVAAALAALGNAAITGMLSMPHDRYQSRAMPLLVLAVTLWLAPLVVARLRAAALPADPLRAPATPGPTPPPGQ
jgi:hypothetical protein